MADPRSSKTEAHVDDRVRGMLDTEHVTKLTLSSIAIHCSISRRTLQSHWRNVPMVIRGCFSRFYEPMTVSVTATDASERLEQALLHIRTTLDSHLTRAAIFVADETGESRRFVFELWRRELGVLVRSFTIEEFVELVGPMTMEMLVFGQVPTSATVRRSVIAAQARR